MTSRDDNSSGLEFSFDGLISDEVRGKINPNDYYLTKIEKEKFNAKRGDEILASITGMNGKKLYVTGPVSEVFAGEFNEQIEKDFAAMRSYAVDRMIEELQDSWRRE